MGVRSHLIDSAVSFTGLHFVVRQVQFFGKVARIASSVNFDKMYISSLILL